ncbi:MAG: hypothetical protein AB7N76_33495 [Planctomycetota bacterium]
MQEPDLNALRDAYVTAARALIDQVEDAAPEQEMRGITGRAGAVLRAQLPVLEALGALDLRPGGADQREVLVAISRAQHLPRMVLAFGEVLRREEKSRAWAAAQQRALELAGDLALLTQCWVIAAAPDLDALEAEEDEGF